MFMCLGPSHTTNGIYVSACEGTFYAGYSYSRHLNWKLDLLYHGWERSSGISLFYYNPFPTIKPSYMPINRALNAGSDFKHMFK